MSTLFLAPAATPVDWSIIKGDAFTLTIPVLDANGNPVTVTGWTVKAQVRRSPVEPVLHEWSAAASNTVISTTSVGLIVDATVTATWTWTDAQVSVVVTDAGGKPHCIAAGQIHALPDITQ